MCQDDLNFETPPNPWPKCVASEKWHNAFIILRDALLANYCPGHPANPDEGLEGSKIKVHEGTTFYGTSECAASQDSTVDFFSDVSGGQDAFDGSVAANIHSCTRSGGAVPTIAFKSSAGNVATYELRIPYNDVGAQPRGRMVLFFSQSVVDTSLDITVPLFFHCDVSQTVFHRKKQMWNGTGPKHSRYPSPRRVLTRPSTLTSSLRPESLQLAWFIWVAHNVQTTAFAATQCQK